MMSFKDLFAAELNSTATTTRTLKEGECQSTTGQRCSLCYAITTDYDTEAPCKDRAVTTFWSELGTAIHCSPLVRSPRGRAYRTVTKRKAFHQRGGMQLGFVGPAEDPPQGGMSVAHCAIEPPSHAAIYHLIEEELHARSTIPLSELLLYAVIKGNYREHVVILNVREITPALVHAANAVSKSLTRQFGAMITGIFLFEGDPQARYYLGSQDRGAMPKLRKLFGKKNLFVSVEGKGFLYPPLSFSQVNESLLDAFIAGARRLLAPSPRHMFYDFYCGYGLFALSISPSVRKVIGVEASHQSAAAATSNAQRLHAANARFVQAVINAEVIETLMQKSPPQSLVLLDPPRGGTAEGVIETIASRRPTRVLHIFCNMDVLPSELNRWFSAGYTPVHAVPFDMFPGTPELEMMVLVQPEPLLHRSN
jgi:tRNA/tmRNA/rRNA uracil-C5-methylase (TrmA/RlmC/RlmD family)